MALKSRPKVQLASICLQEIGIFLTFQHFRPLFYVKRIISISHIAIPITHNSRTVFNGDGQDYDPDGI